MYEITTKLIKKHTFDIGTVCCYVSVMQDAIYSSVPPGTLGLYLLISSHGECIRAPSFMTGCSFNKVIFYIYLLIRFRSLFLFPVYQKPVLSRSLPTYTS